MEGLLARWALAAQEYDFTISYRKGATNTNADALSRKQTPTTEQSAATLCVPQQLPDLQQSQAKDPNFMTNYNLEHIHKDTSGVSDL